MTTLALRPESTALIERVRQRATEIGHVVGLAPLDSPERERAAADLLRAIQTLVAEAEAARKAEKAPALAMTRAVDAAFRAPVAELERVAGLIRDRLAQAAIARERAQAAALARVAPAVQAGDLAGANAALALAGDPVFQPVAGAVAGVSERFSWEPESFDVRAMPLEFLTVDMGKVKAEIADAVRLGREPSIPGVTFRRTATIVARRL